MPLGMAQISMSSDGLPIASSALTTIFNRQLQLTDDVGYENVWNTSAIGTKGEVQLAGCRCTGH